MGVYFDSAIVAKLYVQEATSPDAVRLVTADTPPYVLTHWQELEVKNALCLKVFRHEITLDELRASLAALAEDVAAGRWKRPDLSLPAVFARAEELCTTHATEVGCRTLDILHVAAALIAGMREFASFDNRQRDLAARAGLTVKPLALPSP